MVVVSYAQPNFPIMGTDRIDAGAVPTLASPPAPQPLLSESANPMNRMSQAIHFWDHQDCGGCTKERVLGADLACAVLSLISFNWRESGERREQTKSQRTSTTPNMSGQDSGPQLIHELVCSKRAWREREV